MGEEFDNTMVLVIDDEESICEGCRQTLEGEGFQTRTASDGRLGIRMAERERPRVVLIDLKMPGMSGMEVLKRIRQVNPRTVCIVITGYATVETAVRSMKLGAHDYLRKPFDHTRLLEAVKEGLRESRIDLEEVAPAAVTIEGVSHPGTILDVLERAARDPDFIARLTEEGSAALEEYDLSWDEKAAIISGDLGWVEGRIGKLGEDQKVWFRCRLQQERW
jgi:DNA-binding NtrC family response regulator